VLAQSQAIYTGIGVPKAPFSDGIVILLVGRHPILSGMNVGSLGVKQGKTLGYGVAALLIKSISCTYDFKVMLGVALLRGVSLLSIQQLASKQTYQIVQTVTFCNFVKLD
jgi:hypothetical protein